MDSWIFFFYTLDYNPILFFVVVVVVVQILLALATESFQLGFLSPL